MLQSSHKLTRAHPRPPICPSCRLQAQRRARHASVQHAEHATGPHALAEGLPRRSGAARARPREVKREQGKDKQEAGWDGAMVTDLAGKTLFRQVAASAASGMSPPWRNLRERMKKAANPSLAAAVEAEKARGMKVAAVELDEQPQAGTLRQPVRKHWVRAAAGIPSIRRQWETPFAAKMTGESEQSHDRDAVAGGPLIRRQAGIPRSTRGKWQASRGAKMAEQMRSLDEEAVAGVTLIRTQQGTPLTIRKQETPLTNRKQQPPPFAAKLAEEFDPSRRREWGTPLAAKSEEEAKQSQLEDILDELISASPDGQLGGSGSATLEEGSGAQQLTHDGMAELSPLELIESSHGATLTAIRERRSSRPETVTTVTLDSADSGFLDALGKSEVRQQAAGASMEISRSSPGSVRPPHMSTGLAWQRAPAVSDRSQARAYHISHRSPQQQVALEAETSGPPPELFQVPHRSPENPNGIRAQLRRWQEVHGHENRPNMDIELGADEDTDGGNLSNNLTRLPENNESAIRNTPAEQEDDEREAMAHFTQASSEEPSSAERNTRFLQMGDLVEIEYLKSETPNTVAVFVRRIDGLALAQMYTKQGRWIHVREKIVQYAIPGWVTEDMVKPLLQYLPSEEVVETGMEELMEQAYMKDLSVPREIAAPLVSRMVQFDVEAKDVYRKHARTLDNAHQLLAHDTDLRYGSLVSAATTLLRTPAEKLPMPALFAVRQALSNAGFAFSMDRNSHRLTGYLQIRSKEQVRMVENVRNWLREWQDDLAMTATLSAEQRRRHKPRRGAIHVYDFLDKVRAIIRKSRQDREPTIWGNVGPSKVRIPITPEQDCVRITQEETFNAQDTELVRFMEAWSLSMLFNGLPRILALPPLLLQATGLYENYDFIPQTGMLMLQEIGTVLPYENRVRFDQHLLLPSSQHSRPLQNLMTSLLEMAKNHDFKDSMEDLRHDWGSMPVFCIDEAGAHEIDDGLSVEPAAVATDGTKEWWVHVHIANPTAFFERDHPLAKMARHMGESIYMPERTYMMMPRWSTQRHFSLAPGRPCLTFSARLDDKGRMMEHKIQNGRVKQVLRLTPEDVAVAMGKAEERDGQHPELTLTVGGEVPPERKKKNAAADLTPEMVEQLKVLNLLGDRRRDIRKAAGGMFFDSHQPSVNVWQSSKMSGLAWDNPYRKGWRHVEGDPVIQMKTRGLINWFAPAPNPVKPLVTEMMLLACEISAAWCKERAILAVFRGSIQRPGRMDPDQFFKQVLSPIVAKDPKGEIPMHIGMRYLETFGTTALSVSPFRHKILGMDNYGKATSPLRRYGDMILHWQIEAALREEARTGRSLVTNKSIEEVDRRFLPFSANVLNTIIVGLQPRESMIMRAKSHADSFWMMQLLFRAHEFGETALPFGKTVRAYVHGNSAAIRSDWGLGCILMELNIMATMLPPTGGQGLSAGTKADGLWGRLGDVWEWIQGPEGFARPTH
ncbi:3'-5' RNA exonuclease complex component [Friedmanniomyces endolithicus]|nr:3'-5' RNA exonuclease complex component [Friedmanniomyces endolithicus]KAK0818641.1 3'-5' RNA exonuclease complex component [Friedmanniomyces endolithicus]KAK0842203.1 3'-5' RNA exonuclease complex component [Friedmanniomyces endolithicus]